MELLSVCGDSKLHLRARGVDESPPLIRLRIGTRWDDYPHLGVVLKLHSAPKVHGDSGERIPPKQEAELFAFGVARMSGDVVDDVDREDRIWLLARRLRRSRNAAESGTSFVALSGTT